MRRGSNLPAVGTYNQTLVLDLIRRSPDGISRIELAARTGLSAQTLNNVARRLVAEGWVREVAASALCGGTAARPLAAGYAVPLSLRPFEIVTLRFAH